MRPIRSALRLALAGDDQPLAESQSPILADPAGPGDGFGGGVVPLGEVPERVSGLNSVRCRCRGYGREKYKCCADDAAGYLAQFPKGQYTTSFPYYIGSAGPVRQGKLPRRAPATAGHCSEDRAACQALQ